MPIRSDISTASEERWRRLLIDGHRRLRIAHLVFRHLPSPPRCKVCHNPFDGVGGRLIRLLGYARSRKNPSLCTRCCDRLPPGGAEVDIAVLFADVRGSTALAERLGPSSYAVLMNGFYHNATEVLVRYDAIIDKLVGDEVMALFIPGICGPHYRRRAAEAAFALVQAVGDVPIGAAVHSGIAYVGNVGGEGVVDFTALGDTVNTAARLASVAAAGEVLLSEAVFGAIAAQCADLECRTLTLRGKEAPVRVRVARPGQTVSALES
ncbi:MAG TPA: adenylate/guanylate cyclase domain-containing protein [Stellaceae bacterium]|nr:adenylate/guanylate cyclase domain-containing protein [Stellaceae bacterium]